MFEDALLDSSLRRPCVLHRLHYLISALAAALVFAAGLYLLPTLLVLPTERALVATAALAGAAGGLYAVMVCYVGEDARRQRWWAWPWVALTVLLNLAGFLIYLVYGAHKTGDWKRAALPLAYVAETVFVGALILVPLIYTQALPKQLLISDLPVPMVPPSRPPRPSGPSVRPTPHRPAVDPFAAPTIIPTNIPTIIDPPQPPEMATGPVGPYVPGVPDGFDRGNGFVPGGAPWDTGAPPPPPPSHPAPRQQVIHLPSDIVAAKAIFHPKPDYPPIAISARIQGRVVLQAIIGKDGTIQKLKVLSGHPILARAAVETVQTWRYQPTLLNSEPVEVLTEIDVIFNLSE